MSPVVAWLIAAIVLLIVESFTGTFVILWMGIAAFAAGLVAHFLPDTQIPWLVFVLASAVLIFFTRPLARHIRERHTTRTNVDALVGQYAMVIETIDPMRNTGRVRVGSDEWRARSAGVVESGAWVRITGISGTTLSVEP
jgi:membrane protein implicated in regulation of membrane protease activity